MLAPLQLGQDRVEIGRGQRRVERAQHVVGAQFDDHEVGLARQPVERPAEPRAPGLAGIARHAAVDHGRGDAVAAQARLQLRREAEPAVERIAGGQAVAERQHQRARRRRGLGARRRRGGAYRQSGEQDRPTSHRARCGAIVGGAASFLARAGMTHPLIRVADVDLTLGEGEVRTHILKSVSLTLDPGTSVAVLGPSGSGKSSLMAVIAGLERPDAGSVALAGQELGGLDEDQLARLRGRSLGIILQSFQLLPTMTALENVAVPLELAGASDARASAPTAELEAVGLGHRLRALSGAIVGRRAAARGDRARHRAAPCPAAGRRADRQSRQRHRRGDRRPVVRARGRGGGRACWSSPMIRRSRRARRGRSTWPMAC